MIHSKMKTSYVSVFYFQDSDCNNRKIHINQNDLSDGCYSPLSKNVVVTFRRGGREITTSDKVTL